MHRPVAVRRFVGLFVGDETCTRLCRTAVKVGVYWDGTLSRVITVPNLCSRIDLHPHPSLSSVLSAFRRSLWVQRKQRPIIIRHQVAIAIDLDFLVFSTKRDSLLLHSNTKRRLRQIMSNQGPQLRHKASEPATGKVSHQRGSASEPRSMLSSRFSELIHPFLTFPHIPGRLDRRREGETSRPQSIRQRRGPLFPRPKLSDGGYHHPGECRLRDPMHLPLHPLSQLERQYERSTE